MNWQQNYVIAGEFRSLESDVSAEGRDKSGRKRACKNNDTERQTKAVKVSSSLLRFIIAHQRRYFIHTPLQRVFIQASISVQTETVQNAIIRRLLTVVYYKSSAVAEMGDCLATIDMGQKVGGGCCVPFHGRSWSPSITLLPGPRPTSVPSAQAPLTVQRQTSRFLTTTNSVKALNATTTTTTTSV